MWLKYRPPCLFFPTLSRDWARPIPLAQPEACPQHSERPVWARSPHRSRNGYPRCRRCSFVSLGHLAGLREGYPAFRTRWLMVRTEIRRPIRRLNSTLNRGLEWNRSWCTILSRTRSSQAFVNVWRCPRSLWLGVPVSFDRFKTLEMAPCDTPVMEAICKWVCPSRDKLTIICNVAGVIWHAILWFVFT